MKNRFIFISFKFQSFEEEKSPQIKYSINKNNPHLIPPQLRFKPKSKDPNPNSNSLIQTLEIPFVRRRFWCSSFWVHCWREGRRNMMMRWERVHGKARAKETPDGRTPAGRKGGIWGPGRRWGHTCNAIKSGRFLYVFGGYGEDNCQTNDVHVFDTGMKLTSMKRKIRRCWLLRMVIIHAFLCSCYVYLI